MSSGGEAFWIGVFVTTVICAFMPNTKVNTTEWDWAVFQCAPNGGFADMAGESLIRNASVTCRNGARFVKRDEHVP